MVLFLCTPDAGRSQLAPGFFEHLTGDARAARIRVIRALNDPRRVWWRG